MSPTDTALQLQPLKQETIQQLAKVSQPNCVSILMPTWESGRETRQGRIRLGNLLDEVQKTTSAEQVPALKQIASLVDNESFWQHQGKGLAIYCYGDQCDLFRLHHNVEQQCQVGDRLLIQPLACQQACARSYLVLALTWEAAQLFEANHDEMSEVESDDWPATFEDLITPRDPETQLQHHSHDNTYTGGGDTTTMYHGHGDGEDKTDADRKNYLSRVAELLGHYHYDSDTPLIMMATDEVHGHFQSETDEKFLAHVSGSPANQSASSLHKKVQSVAEKQLAASRKTWQDRLEAGHSNNQVKTDLQDIALAAVDGRVDLLLIDREAKAWGTFDTNQRTIAVSESPQSDDQNLVNLAVVEVLNHGGTVHCVTPDDLPGDNGWAAVLRF